MFKKIGMIALASTLAAGCAFVHGTGPSVPMESAERTTTAKKFNPPSELSSGLYIYRHRAHSRIFKTSVWVDGKCIGDSAQRVFFYEEVEGDKSHKVSSKSQDPYYTNDMLIDVKSGMNYFIRQYNKFGGWGIELVEEERGKEEVSELDMAVKGTCSKPCTPNFLYVAIASFGKPKDKYCLWDE